MTHLRSIGTNVAGSVWVGLRAFLGTACAAMLGGIVLAGVSYYFVRGEHYGYVVTAIAMVLVEAVGIALVVGWKKAVVLTLAHGIGALRLGRSSVRQVFDRILAIAPDDNAETGTGRIAQRLEQLPLAQAQELLNRAVRSVMGDDEHGGWLWRRVRQWSLRLVQKFTLARFRKEGIEYGGIDLMKVKKELEETIDDAIVRKLRKGLRLLTILTIIGFPLVVAVQTWGIVMLSQRIPITP